MIRKTRGGYLVVSEHKTKKGKRKRLSKVLKSRGAAVKRLQEVEYFKHKGHYL